MQKYESQQHQILRPVSQIYALLSRFDNFTSMLGDKVEEWSADENHCSFKAKGFTVKLVIIDKEEDKFVKITGDDGGVPIDFNFWIQLHKVADYDTRMRLVLHADLNMMMKMMIGGKLKDGIDNVAKMLADAMNGKVPEGFDPSKM